MNPLSQQIIDDATALDGQLTDLNEQITDLNAQLAACAARKPVVYAGLEKNQLFLHDKKIPFQWIQPGNTGNTGGGSDKPHGTCTWVTGDQTTISIVPSTKTQYDNFFFYCILPYPTTAPSRLRWTAGNYQAASPADWAKSQQMEWQIEEFRNGFQYTCGWAVNPHSGLNYWAGAKKWQAFPGGASVNSLAAPTAIMCEQTLDHTAHTYTYNWIVVNGVMMNVGITVPCVTAPIGKAEYSVAVQLDGNAHGDPYSGLLDNLFGEWE